MGLWAVLFGSRSSIASVACFADAAAAKARSTSSAAALQGSTDSAILKQAWSAWQQLKLRELFAIGAFKLMGAPVDEQHTDQPLVLPATLGDKRSDFTRLSHAWHGQRDSLYASKVAAATGSETPDLAGAVVRLYSDVSGHPGRREIALAHYIGGPGSAANMHRFQLLPASLLVQQEGAADSSDEDPGDDDGAGGAAQPPTFELSSEEVLWRVLPAHQVGQASRSRERLLKISQKKKKDLAEARTLQELRWGVELLLAQQASTGRKLPVFDQSWSMYVLNGLGKKSGTQQDK